MLKKWTNLLKKFGLHSRVKTLVQKNVVCSDFYHRHTYTIPILLKDDLEHRKTTIYSELKLEIVQGDNCSGATKKRVAQKPKNQQELNCWGYAKRILKMFWESMCTKGLNRKWHPKMLRGRSCEICSTDIMQNSYILECRGSNLSGNHNAIFKLKAFLELTVSTRLCVLK